jgi:two-component system, NtrC family, response regulator AtoC
MPKSSCAGNGEPGANRGRGAQAWLCSPAAIPGLLLPATVAAAGLTARNAAVVSFPASGRTAAALIERAGPLLRPVASEGEAGGTEPVLEAEAVRSLYRLAARAAAGQTASGLISVLVLGETGTGKDVLASWIHRRSPRACGPFVCINCAALNETLLESELFGHEKGAFTGATQTKRGLLEAAAGGTVFLDEIGEMSLGVQTKLLRALEAREVTRVGGLAARPIDVRFIAATNRDLEADVGRKAFRADLFFRINGISLTVPPLRERVVEIPVLARRFLAQAARPGRRRTPRLSAEALAILKAYAWPGNIRELRNVVERALVLCEGTVITAEHLPVDKMRLQLAASAADAAAPQTEAPLADAGVLSPADMMQRQRILRAMAAHGGNQTRVAKALGIARGTLIARLERYRIRRPQAQ